MLRKGLDAVQFMVSIGNNVAEKLPFIENVITNYVDFVLGGDNEYRAEYAVNTDTYNEYVIVKHFNRRTRNWEEQYRIYITADSCRAIMVDVMKHI